MIRKLIFSTFPLLLILAAQPLAAQAPFTIRVQQGNNVATIADGGTITMAADALGTATSASITVTYTGTVATATINAFEFTGSLDFAVSGTPTLPATLNRNQSFTFGVTYTPTISQRQTARLAFNYTQDRTTANVIMNLAGTSPEFVFSYIPQGGNATPINPDGTIAFPVTNLTTTTNVTVVVANRGTSAGVVNAINVTGNDVFQAAGLPLPQTSVDAGRDLRFTVNFTPKTLDAATGSVAIDFVGRRVQFQMSGSAQGPVWSYEFVRAGEVTPIQPNGLITLPDTVLSETSSIVVRVRNSGNFEGRITQISVQGTGFTLTDIPFLPLTLAVGASATMTVNFIPTATGLATGRVRIGDDSFNLAGTGLGVTLTYSYRVAGASTTVSSGGSVNFTSVAVGGISEAQFLVSNTGTAASSVTSVSLSTTGTIFTISGVPPLPARLEPGATLAFSLSFSPTALGPQTSTLRVDNATFTLSGTATQPPALPSYRIEGAGTTIEPLQQPTVRLTMSQPYPLPLTGTLTLAFNSAVFSADPSVQFATGGRTVNFTIPANATSAVFPDGSNQIRLQSGTVAGSITLTPFFATEGGINLTPTNPPGLTLTIAESAPRLLNVALQAKTINTITLAVTGYATGRSITQMTFDFTPITGETVQTTRLSLNVESSFLAWYQTLASQQFGSLFTVTIPFTLAGDVKDATTVADTVQSVNVTLANRQGNSNSMSLNLR